MKPVYKYYKGESECPKEFLGKSSEKFWYGEKVSSSPFSKEAVFDEWVKRADEARRNAPPIKQYIMDKYTDAELAVLLFITYLYATHCPMKDLSWTYEYGL